MDLPPYIRTDTSEDAVASLELAAAFFSHAMADDRYWKWFVVAFHSGIQGLFALALEGGNGFLVQKPEVTKKMLSAMDLGEGLPEPNMDNFMRLYKKLQVPGNLRYADSLPIPESETRELALESLNSIRNNFLHFNVKGWSIERELIVQRAAQCLEVAEFVCSASRNILWYEPKNEERVKLALKSLRQFLPIQQAGKSGDT